MGGSTRRMLTGEELRNIKRLPPQPRGGGGGGREGLNGGFADGVRTTLWNHIVSPVGHAGLDSEANRGLFEARGKSNG